MFGDRALPVVALVVLSVLAGLTESVVLTLIAQVAAALVSNVHLVHVTVGPWHISESLVTLLLVGLALSLARLLLMVPLSSMPARIASGVVRGLRVRLFAAFTRASWEIQSREREGHVQEMMTNQIGYAASGAMAATQLVIAGLTLLVLIVSSLLLNVLAAAFVLATVVVLFGLLRPLDAAGARRARSLSQVQMNFASGVGEANRLAEETHVFGRGAAQLQRVADLADRTRVLAYQTQMIGGLIGNLYRALIYVLVIVGLIVLHVTHSGHIASLGAVVLLLVRGGGYGQVAQSSYQTVRQALPFVERVQNAAARYEYSAPVARTRRLAGIRALSFEHVSFGYTSDVEVLTDITFGVAGGESIGIVGPSGAGKSTLSQLLLRLRQPQEGRYRVNGEPADDFADEDWHALVAYVAQEPRLLHASVADNIRYFREIEDAAVEEAARLARIHDDVMSWSDGYDTIVGPRADAISGGQQQRICIARALVGRPAMLILDEPTSALDPRSERLLQDSLRAVQQTLTLFVIAHRMSTLEICDRVMVIVDGRLEAIDTPANLRRQGGYFRATLDMTAGSAERPTLAAPS